MTTIRRENGLPIPNPVGASGAGSGSPSSRLRGCGLAISRLILTAMPEPGKSIGMAKAPKASGKQLPTPRPVESLIHVIRGQKVLLDIDLAELYGVATKAFNQAIKRNAARFPEDFMIRLDHRESAVLRSQCDRIKKKH